MNKAQKFSFSECYVFESLVFARYRDRQKQIFILFTSKNFSYSSDERIKEIEERLDDYKYKMTRFEELQVNTLFSFIQVYKFFPV